MSNRFLFRHNMVIPIITFPACIILRSRGSVISIRCFFNFKTKIRISIDKRRINMLPFKIDLQTVLWNIDRFRNFYNFIPLNQKNTFFNGLSRTNVNHCIFKSSVIFILIFNSTIIGKIFLCN